MTKVYANAGQELDALAREHGLKVDRAIFDGGMTVTVSGTIGRLPYRQSTTREWSDTTSADMEALHRTKMRLATNRFGR